MDFLCVNASMASLTPFLGGLTQAWRNSEATKRGGGRVPITNYFINTIVTALQSPEWEVLFNECE